MKHLKCWSVIGIFFVLVIGSLSHFLYDWTNKNFLVSLFTPVNESVWEHMKLLFFPMLLYALVMALTLKENYPCVTSSLCFGILAGTLLIPVFFYSYTYIFGKDIFILDLASFVLSTVIAFWIAYRFTLSCKLHAYTHFLCCLVWAFFLCFMIFTCWPPKLGIFISPE